MQLTDNSRDDTQETDPLGEYWTIHLQNSIYHPGRDPTPYQRLALTALIDSGANENFMDQAMAEQLHLKFLNP